MGTISGSSNQRLWALKEHFGKVVVCNTDQFAKQRTIFSKVYGHFSKTPCAMHRHRELQREISKVVSAVQPGVIWMEWPRMLEIGFVNSLRSGSYSPVIISFQDDNPFGDRHATHWMWSNYLKIIPEFDLHLVKRESDVINLENRSAKSSYKWTHGVFSPWFHPSPTATSKQYPLSFVGTCFDDRLDFVKRLLDAKIPLHVFGNRWDRNRALFHKYRDHFHPAVEGESYAEVIRQSQMCLGLVSSSNRDEWTMRTFEVAGCGTALLAQDTPSHREFFVPDEEIALFKDVDDCIHKARFYLERPDALQAIGKAARRRCESSRYFLENRTQELLAWMTTRPLL